MTLKLRLKPKPLVAIFLLCQLGYSELYSDTSGLSSVLIDTQALDDKRLFFSENQRHASDKTVVKKELATQSRRSDSLDASASNAELADHESNKLLHYSGSVRSKRSVQLLLNGYPWVPGQLAIVSARLQPDTQIIEIKTTSGEVIRLSLGETVELKP